MQVGFDPRYEVHVKVDIIFHLIGKPTMAGSVKDAWRLAGEVEENCDIVNAEAPGDVLHVSGTA